MRKTSLTAGAAALLLVLSGCGSDDSADGGGDNGGSGGDSGGVGQLFTDADELADTASQNTSAKNSAKVDGSMSVGPQEITYSGEGEFGAEPKATMTMDMGGQTFETVVIGETVYVQMAAGGQYIKMDTSELTGQQGGMQSAEMNDPTKLLEFAQKAGEITDSEETTLDGQPATHYTLDLDFAKMTEEAGGLSGMSEEMLKDVDATIPMELWLDGENLPAKVTMDMSELMTQAAEQQGGGAQVPEGGMTMEMNYSDWGAPVNVEEPPADQVQEAPAGLPGGNAPAPVPGG